MKTRRFIHLPSLALAALLTLFVSSVGADPVTLVLQW
jgi:hypothetical protein